MGRLNCLSNVNGSSMTALSANAAAKKRLEENVVKVVQAETGIKKTSPPSQEDPPRELPMVLDAVGIRLSEDAKEAIRLFETDYLVPQITPEAIQALLKHSRMSWKRGSNMAKPFHDNPEKGVVPRVLGHTVAAAPPRQLQSAISISWTTRRRPDRCRPLAYDDRRGYRLRAAWTASKPPSVD